MKHNDFQNCPKRSIVSILFIDRTVSSISDTLRLVHTYNPTAGLTNLFEPDSYFMVTELHEGQPVCYTPLK